MSLTERLTRNLKEALDKHQGQVVEIGCGNGNNTVAMAEVALKHNRTVYAIDPFEQLDGDLASYTRPYSLNEFNVSIRPHSNIVHVHERSEDSYNFLPEEIAFAFVDGLQTYYNVMGDLQLMEGAHIICVDDYNRSTGISQVPEAVDTFINNSEYKIKQITEKEVYLWIK